MIRQVVEDIYQIGTSIAGEHGYESIQVYVLLNDGKPILIDTGCFIHKRQIMDELQELLKDNPPSFVFLTHTELPHTGNLGAILDIWPDIKVVISSVLLPYSEMPYFVDSNKLMQVSPGETRKFGQRKLTFTDAILKDQPGTLWIYDNQTKTLFTADGFGYLHDQTNQNQFSDEIQGGISQQWFEHYHRESFGFLHLVNAEKLNADLDRVFSKRTINILAPTHGSAIRNDIDSHLNRVKDSIINISQSNSCEH